jgi:4-carboxymuconolactone decarboxylase
LLAEQLLDTHAIDNEYYAQGIEVFGERGMLELVSIVGYYCLVSLTLNAFTIPLDEGMSDPFPEKK